MVELIAMVVICYGLSDGLLKVCICVCGPCVHMISRLIRIPTSLLLAPPSLVNAQKYMAAFMLVYSMIDGRSHVESGLAS